MPHARKSCWISAEWMRRMRSMLWLRMAHQQASPPSERSSRNIPVAMLGCVAILLSAIGLAGLAGYTVAQRTREIGLRIALGARAAQVVRTILAPMSHAIVIGFVCGALGGAAVAKVLRSGIPAMAGINVFDPLAYLVAMAFFAAVVALSI